MEKKNPSLRRQQLSAGCCYMPSIKRYISQMERFNLKVWKSQRMHVPRLVTRLSCKGGGSSEELRVIPMPRIDCLVFFFGKLFSLFVSPITITCIFFFTCNEPQGNFKDQC